MKCGKVEKQTFLHKIIITFFPCKKFIGPMAYIIIGIVLAV